MVEFTLTQAQLTGDALAVNQQREQRTAKRSRAGRGGVFGVECERWNGRVERRVARRPQVARGFGVNEATTGRRGAVAIDRTHGRRRHGSRAVLKAPDRRAQRPFEF
jgi:hypothetical protein